jgi:hypothetical protein
MSAGQNYFVLNRPEDNSNHSENRSTFLAISEGGFEADKRDVPAEGI